MSCLASVPHVSAAANMPTCPCFAVLLCCAAEHDDAMKLSYCRDILKGPYAQWALKDVKAAFLCDRPLTPDEFDSLRGRYAPAKPAAAVQQQYEQEEDGSSRRRGR